MGNTIAIMSKAAALVLCAGAGFALAGPAGGTAGASAGSLLGGLIGGLLSGAAANFAHQLLDGFASFFGDSMSRPIANAPNHDLTAIAVSAIRDTLSAAAGQLGQYDNKYGAATRIASATPEQIADTLASVPNDALDEASILAVIGTPMGGSTTTTKTPAFWVFIATDLAKKTDAKHSLPTGLKGAVTRLKDLATSDLTPTPIDRDADASIDFVAGFLHSFVANQTNNLLRGSTELSSRARHAAMFAFLRAILDAVRAPGSGATMTDELRDTIKATITSATADLLREPQWFTAANQQFTTSLTTHVDSITGQLSTLGADTTEIKKCLSTLTTLIHAPHAPYLSLPPPDKADEGGRFVFRNERLAMVGRESQLAELTGWLADPRSFSWDLWTGPAGAGKSRLARELCNQNPSWTRGFFDFDKDKTPRWDLWQPTANTLIIFDYVAEHAIVIANALKTLAERTRLGVKSALPTALKVRVLLLEREIVRGGSGSNVPLPDWLNTLLDTGKACGDLFRITHRRQDLILPEKAIVGVNEDAIKAILQEEHLMAQMAAGQPPAPLDDATIIYRLGIVKQVDPRQRPLFAAMAAEAIRRSGGRFELRDKRFGVDAVVEYIRAKEWEHWDDRLAALPGNAKPDRALWARMVCLATMCSGIHKDGLTEAMNLDASVGLPHAADWGNGSTYGALVSGASGEDAPPLEPDILGEAFVLWLLKEHPQMARPLIAAAWSLEMAAFVARAAQNFPMHPALNSLFTPPKDTVAWAHGGTVARIRADLALRLLIMGQHPAAAGHIDAAISWGEAQSPRDERSLAIWYASRASIRQQRGLLKESEDDLAKSITWGEAQSPRDERSLAIWYASRASIRQDRGLLKEVDEDLAKSISWGEAQFPRDEHSLAIWYASRASIRQLRGLLREADEDLAKSITWSEAQSPRDERSLAIWYASRASIRSQRGLLKEAEEDLAKSITWEESQSEPNQRELTIRYVLRANIRWQHDLLEEAEEDLAKSITWFEAQSPRDERGLAIVYATRALIRHSRGLLKEAEEDIAKTITWEESQSEPNQRELAIRYALRANIRWKRDLFMEAEEDLAKSITWSEDQFPRDERSLAIGYASRADIRRSRGLLKEAEEDLAKSISWFEAQTPRNERSLAVYYATRASVRQQRGLLKEAKEDLAKSISWEEAQAQPNQRELAIRYASRAQIRKAQAISARRAGEMALATALFAEANADIAGALAWFEKQMPSDERSIDILLEDQARIDTAAKGE